MRHTDSTLLQPDSVNRNIDFTFRISDTLVAVFEAVLPPPPIPVDENIFLPSAFTPNGDGRNDYFYFVYGKDLLEMSLRVFNRWGEEVFHSSRPDRKWDGTYKGLPCEMGTYYYHLEVTLDNGSTRKKKQISGEVNLIR